MRTENKHPARAIALLALNNDSPLAVSSMLEKVIEFSFDQLCWRRSHAELRAFMDKLTVMLNDEA